MTSRKCDEYGLFSAVKAGLHTFSMMARRTGRTTRMIERIKDGDILICSTSDERRDIERGLREAGKDKVKIVVQDPTKRFDNPALRTNGEVHFDHWWVEQRIADALKVTEADLVHIRAAIQREYRLEDSRAPEVGRGISLYLRSEDWEREAAYPFK